MPKSIELQPNREQFIIGPSANAEECSQGTGKNIGAPGSSDTYGSGRCKLARRALAGTCRVALSGRAAKHRTRRRGRWLGNGCLMRT